MKPVRPYIDHGVEANTSNPHAARLSRSTLETGRALNSTEGIIMKRIAQTLLVISLATAGVTAFAATPSFPSSANETTSLVSEFPNMQTYAAQHRNDVARQSPMTYPSAAAQVDPR